VELGFFARGRVYVFAVLLNTAVYQFPYSAAAMMALIDPIKTAKFIQVKASIEKVLFVPAVKSRVQLPQSKKCASGS
jgi:hypothetical protein